MKIDVYDPAMCCSTGVCGPSVDPALAMFASDLDWLGQRGIEVRRFNLGQEPGAFADHDGVRALLQDQGEVALPAVYVDGSCGRRVASRPATNCPSGQAFLRRACPAG